MRALVGAVLAVAVVAAACSGDDGDISSPSANPGPAGDDAIDEGPAREPQRLEWRDCEFDLECASVAVPLDHADPAGASIEVAIARRPAEEPDLRIGTLFVNPGGPGASAIEFLPFVVAGDAVHERFDLVAVEPRGLPGSAALGCATDLDEIYGVDPTVEDQGDVEAMIAVSEQVAAECEASAGRLLEHVGSRDVVADMDAVRAAMGEETISYLGYSYGTVLGQVYADAFPDRVRAMVLDGVVDPAVPGLDAAAEQAEGFERALEAFADDCTEEPVCALAPDPLAAVDRVIAEAEDDLPAPGADRDLGPGEVALGLAYGLYSATFWPMLAQAVDAALGGDGTQLVDMADQYLGREGDQYEQSFGVYFAVNCTDFAWPSDPQVYVDAAAEVAERAPRLGEAVITDYLRCAHWPAERDPLEPTSAPGAPTILVVSTTGDPATPHQNAVEVAERLDDAVLLTKAGEGHGITFTGDACIDRAVVDYLIDLEPPTDGTVCR